MCRTNTEKIFDQKNKWTSQRKTSPSRSAGASRAHAYGSELDIGSAVLRCCQAAETQVKETALENPYCATWR